MFIKPPGFFARPVPDSAFGRALFAAPVDGGVPPPVNSVAPTVGGTGEIGQLLTVTDSGTWSGDPVLTYQWQRDGANIPDATDDVYLLDTSGEDDGMDVRCRVRGTNAGGSADAFSNAISVTWPAPVAAGGLVAQTFEQDSGVQTYNVKPDFANAAGGTWSLVSPPTGVTIDQLGVVSIDTDATGVLSSQSITVRYTNSGGSDDSAFSLTVTSSLVAPANTVAPTLSGNPSVGLLMTVASTGTWTGTPAPSLAIQWQIDSVDVSGATGPTYTPVLGDLGKQLRVKVTGTNGAGSANAFSSAVTVRSAEYIPEFMNNADQGAGTGQLLYSLGYGTDSQYFDMFWLYDDITATAGAARRVYTLTGRHVLTLQTDDDLELTLRNTANTIVFHFVSTDPLPAGPGLLHFHADLGATPTWAVRVTPYAAGTAAAWADVAGSADTVTANSTLDNNRASGGQGTGVMTATDATLKLESASSGFLWVSHDAPVADTDMYDWALFDPATVGSPVVLLEGEEGFDQGINTGTGPAFTSAGDWTVVGGSPAFPYPDPEPFLGDGKNAIGGGARGTGVGGKVVQITSTSNSAAVAGSFPWALTQHVGQRLYLRPVIEGLCSLPDTASTRRIDREGVTWAGDAAPGAGFGFKTNRLLIEAGNFVGLGLCHYGNDVANEDDSDCIRIGVFSGSSSGTDHVDDVYLDRCLFRGGRDEVFAITPRTNGLATGNKVRTLSLLRSIVANPVNPSHCFLFFIGDGTEDATFWCNLLSVGTARFPFQREFSLGVKWSNNAGFNFNENCIAIVGNAGTDIRSCHLQLGPFWNNVRAPVSFDAGTRPNARVNDVVIDSTIGKTNSHGVTRGGTPTGSALTLDPAIDEVAGSEVKALILAESGPRGYGGVVRPLAQAVLDDYSDGDTPTTLPTYPGPEPTMTGGVYPAHTNYVPDFLTDLVGTDLEAIHPSGPWAGYMVAEIVDRVLTLPA